MNYQRHAPPQLKYYCTGGVALKNSTHTFSPQKDKKFPEPRPIDLRDATDAEVGRIKGDALRLAGHPDGAHYTLIAPYIRGQKDPELLAAIGIDEVEEGEAARGRKFLEAATSLNSKRALSYLELAEWKAQKWPGRASEVAHRTWDFQGRK